MGRKGSTRKKGSSAAVKGLFRKRNLLGSFLIFLILAAAAAWQQFYGIEGAARPSEILTAATEKLANAAEAVPPLPEFAPALPGPETIVRVKRVVDGDTLVILNAGREERIRMLNVDTPESVHPEAKKNTLMGRRASDFTKRELENRQVRIEEASAETEVGDEKDRYGRVLAYVLVDGENFNVRLVREGYSFYETKYGKSRRYDHEFKLAEAEAKSNQRGLWATGVK